MSLHIHLPSSSEDDTPPSYYRTNSRTGGDTHVGVNLRFWDAPESTDIRTSPAISWIDTLQPLFLQGLVQWLEDWWSNIYSSMVGQLNSQALRHQMRQRRQTSRIRAWFHFGLYQAWQQCRFAMVSDRESLDSKPSTFGPTRYSSGDRLLDDILHQFGRVSPERILRHHTHTPGLKPLSRPWDTDSLSSIDAVTPIRSDLNTALDDFQNAVRSL